MYPSNLIGEMTTEVPSSNTQTLATQEVNDLASDTTHTPRDLNVHDSD